MKTEPCPRLTSNLVIRTKENGGYERLPARVTFQPCTTTGLQPMIPVKECTG